MAFTDFKKLVDYMIDKLYNLINYSKPYAVFSFLTVVVSLLPLMVKGTALWMDIIEDITTFVFIIDYILRWVTVGYKKQNEKRLFILYPFTIMALIDLATILPAFILLNQGLKALRVIRLLLILRLFRFIKESKSFIIITKVIEREKYLLAAVWVIALGYIFFTALIVFNVEPSTFENFFDAIYWACISLTTVGYGDIYPTSLLGRAFAMVSSMVGIAIIALPAGIITGGYIEVMRNENIDK